MNTSTRLRYVRAIRALTDADAGVQLLTAYEAELRHWPAELCAVEQLPDWDHATLMHLAAESVNPTGLDAASIMSLTEYRLIGLLSHATEQAVRAGDRATALQLSVVLNQTMIHIRGGHALSAAFDREAGDLGDDAAEDD